MTEETRAAGLKQVQESLAAMAQAAPAATPRPRDAFDNNSSPGTAEFARSLKLPGAPETAQSGGGGGGGASDMTPGMKAFAESLKLPT